MSVVRVGFLLGEVGWHGGVNYFRNLFAAIRSLPAAEIQPVVFAGLRSDVSAFAGLAEIVRTPILDRYTLQWWASKFLGRIFPRRDYLFYWLLRTNQIDMGSHFGPIWRECSIPFLGWIGDCQHRHLPQFFDEKECVARDTRFKNMLRDCSAVLVSSQDVLNDVNRFYPDSSRPIHILRFVSSLHHASEAVLSYEDLVTRYQLGRAWFHIPNQMWAHKNHAVVLEALRILKGRNISPLVIATGSTQDYRNPDFFRTLTKRISDYGLQNEFITLGVLPYAVVMSLMKYSIAIINPSLFEGWSTSVEESKSMGKQIVLSNITVHREQAPEFGFYFDPMDPDALALHMQHCMETFDAGEDALRQRQAQSNRSSNMINFAKSFESIVMQMMQKKAAPENNAI